jgi:hypothetical protein
VENFGGKILRGEFWREYFGVKFWFRPPFSPKGSMTFQSRIFISLVEFSFQAFNSPWNNFTGPLFSLSTGLMEPVGPFLSDFYKLIVFGHYLLYTSPSPSCDLGLWLRAKPPSASRIQTSTSLCATGLFLREL